MKALVHRHPLAVWERRFKHPPQLSWLFEWDLKYERKIVKDLKSNTNAKKSTKVSFGKVIKAMAF
jgi:hypothetical protein